jgi:predicted lipid-binding transport protein (Tim44 family)
MTDISGFELTGLAGMIGFILICLILVIVFTKLEQRFAKKPASNQQPAPEVPQKENESAPADEGRPAFIVGQVYQMEDGSLAEYAADGTFRKIKEK